MSSYYNVRIEYQKEDESGRYKTIKESYLFDALSFTEAEAKGYDVLHLFVAEDFQVISINPVSFTELVKSEESEDSETPLFYKVKLAYDSINDKTGKAKRVKFDVLVKALDFNNAIHTLNSQVIDKWLVDLEIEAVALTPVLELFEN